MIVVTQERRLLGRILKSELFVCVLVFPELRQRQPSNSNAQQRQPP